MSSIKFLRQFRLGEYAIFDFAVSFLGIYLLSPLLSKSLLKLGLDVPRQNWLFLTLPLSILTHLLAGSITPMTRDFIDLQGHYLLKILILGLLFLGFMGVKRVK